MKSHNLKLIDSTYSAQDAKEVLISLVNDKIKFLHLQILSQGERFGCDTSHLEERAKALLIEKEQLMQLLSKLNDDGCEVEIKCDVAIKVKETQNA